MAGHDALISGSFIIQFFDYIFWKESNLNMYIQEGEGVSAFGQYLCRNDGYRLENESIGQDTYDMGDAIKALDSILTSM
jgi:hypothetical protein